MEPSDSPRILLVDRRQLVRSALERMLCGPPLDAVVTTCARSDDALARLKAEPVDLVLCEVAAEPIGGCELARRLTASGGARVAVLVETVDEARIDEAIEAGAAGLLSGEATDEQFTTAVAAILRGHFVASSALAGGGGRTRRDEREAAAAAFRLLSKSEREILLLLGNGVPIDTIAAGRGTSKKTVRNHVASVYRKLQLRCRADVILWFARMRPADTLGIGEASALPAERAHA